MTVEAPVQDEASESLAKALVDTRNTARTLWEAYSDRTKKILLVENHSLDYWTDFFKIPIPEGADISPGEQKRLSARAGVKIQQANTMLRNIKYRAADLNETYEQEVHKEVTRLLAEWRKTHTKTGGRAPAQEFFEKEAKANKAQLARMCAQAKATLDFFIDIERTLITTLKTLDQISWANSHEIKADGYIPRAGTEGST